MTNKLFDLQSYTKEFDALVRSCQQNPKNPKEYWVELDQTAFFPEGGGQPADIGTLDGIAVEYVSEKQGIITHHCAAPLPVGSTVHGILDWQRRFGFMQTHCGEHILSGILKREYGLQNVGFHMGKDFTTIDMDGEMTDEMVTRAEALANDAIAANVPVRVYYPSREELEHIPLRKKPEVEQLRVVEVTGYDWCGCCGTHVANTGEIQLIKIIDHQRYKGGTRLFFHCGQRALQDYSQKHKMIKLLGEEFSCKAENVAECVHKMQEELSAVKGRAAEKNKQLFELLGCRLEEQAPVTAEGIKWLFLWDGGFTPDEAKAFAMAMAKKPGLVCTFFTPTSGGVRYAAAKSRGTAFGLKNLCAQLNQETGGKGGGSEELFCGNIPQAVEETLKTLLQNLLQTAG